MKQPETKSIRTRERINLLFLLFALAVWNFPTQSFAQSKMAFTKQRLERLNRVMQANKAAPGNFSAKKAGNSTMAAGAFSVTPASSAQGGLSLQAIVQSLVGNGVTISNVTCNAPDSLRAVGAFNNGASVFGINSGLLMTSGSVDNAIGPNKTSWTSQDNQMPGYIPMDSLGFDATIIDFDLVSTTNLMTFKYVFASEEYNEYVGSVFNDQFSFFITGPGYSQPTNIALIPNSTTPVSINNVNMGLNAIHYLNNDTAGGLIPADMNRFNTFEYDGLTRVLTTTTLNLVPGATYHLKLVVQDVGDHIYDSGVFIEGGSITSDLCVMQLYPEVYPITDTGNGMDGRIEIYVSGANGVPHAVWSNGVTEELEIINLGPGTYNVVVTDDAGCVATLPAPIVLGGGGPVDSCQVPAIPGTISGPTKVCRNSTGIVYSVSPVPGATSYEWSFPNGASGSSTTNVVTASFSSTFTGGDIEVKAFNVCGESPHASALTVSFQNFSTKPTTPAAISGVAAGACSDQTRTYSVAPVEFATTYLWTAPVGATILSGQGSTSVEIAFPDGFISGTLSVKASNCVGSSTAKSLALTRVTAVPALISGPTKEVCAGSTQTYTCTEVAGAAFYNWVVPAGAVIEDGEGTNNIVVSFPESFTTGKISVSSSTSCYTSGLRTISLISKPSTAASITGPNLGVCAGSVQTYSCPISTTGATGYAWSTPSGATFTGEGTNSITVTFPAEFGASGTISVAATNACGSSASKSLLVRSIPATPASITGTSTAVCGGSTQIYTCPTSSTGATSFNWTVPAGSTINSGQGSNTISITLPDGFISGNISVAAVNGCGQSVAKTLALKAYTAQPGAITGPASNLCGGGVFSYSIAPVAGALSYNWTAPAGCTVEANGGNVINLNVPANFVSGSLSVTAVNTCGNSTARSLALTRLPAAPAAISGPSSVCPGAIGQAFSTLPVGSLSYNWTVPTGAAVTSGQGSASVLVNWGSVAGNITVKAVNACGSSAGRSLAVGLAACRAGQNEEAISSNLDASQIQATVYPNPGSGRFTLEWNGNIDNGKITVYNVLGTKVLDEELGNELHTYFFNLENQSPGMYFLRIQSKGFEKEIRLMKQ